MTRQELDQLLKKARSPFIGERAEAERAIQQMGPDGIDQLLQLVESQYKSWRKRRRVYFSLVAAFCIFALPVVLFLTFVGLRAAEAGDFGRVGAAIGGAWGGIVGGFGGGVLGGFSWLLAPFPSMLRGASLLARIDDLRAIPALTRTLTGTMVDVEMRVASAKALARLLPRLDDSTADLLNGEDREALARYLVKSRPEKEEALVLGIVHALSWCGNAETLRCLQAFEKRINSEENAVRAGAEAGRWKLVVGVLSDKRPPVADRLDSRPAELQPLVSLREATRAAVERLVERVARASHGENLLRASTEQGDNGASLLRPSEGAGAADSNLLLRVSPDSLNHVPENPENFEIRAQSTH